jgi:hypothetical protein
VNEGIPLGPDRFTVDRIEGDYLVLEGSDGRTFDLHRLLAPDDAAAGDVITLELERGAGWTRATLRVDPEATRKAQREVAQRLKRLREDDPGGERIP